MRIMKSGNHMALDSGYPILLVEDSPDSLKIIERTLTKAGNEVQAVRNGIEALNAFGDRFFPIVLTDWMMPEMDGVELCRTIRKNPGDSYVYIILLTARDSTAEIVTGLEAGADDYLTKPFSADELLARLKTAKRILDLERTLRQANDEIKLLSMTDALTGSYNRGYLTEQIPKEIERARRYKHPFSIILCDIDNFKRINDTYGHEAGNCIIKAFVDCISKTIRQDVDWVARYGGEEFLVVAPETNTDGAIALAERIPVNIEATELKIDQHEIRLTASFGALGFDPAKSAKDITLEVMVTRADQHLYECKMEGRNKVKGSTI